MDDSNASQNIIDLLSTEFAQRFRLGERPLLSEYLERYPQHAVEIEELFPTLLMLEKLKPRADELTAESAAVAEEHPHPKQLGDFRILREIGRGGMGIVYEAEQESLGRRVALKILPGDRLQDPRQEKRFQREARAAARLHHTNIVPVFGVGKHEGLHYYAMQFIAGSGLDEVLIEIRRLRDASGAEVSADQLNAELRRSGLEHTVAESLLSGEFEPGVVDIADATAAHAVLSQSEKNFPAEVSSGARPNPHPERSANDPQYLKLAASTAAGHLSETARMGFPGHSGERTLSRVRCTYSQSVARIGSQAAEALQYAHSQGILHRDIKPSNLLLDPRGTLWITDFGLAKADDQPDLTHSGDIVGTVRYMAPEMFGGHGDARSDVYSLGLTLYELLALQPAFSATDSRRLIRQVMDETPPRLRSLVPAIPRDLETIVHKAMERDPALRYQSAAELADELQRFLGDEPIRARRISLSMRLARWSRRNPAVAALVAVVALLLAGGMIASSLAALHFDRLAQREVQAADDERDARRAAERASSEAEAARKQEELQRVRAEANFRQAKSVVDDYLTKVSENELLSVPGLQPLRRDLLTSALAFYQDFLKEQEEDPSLKADLAAAYLRVGKIYNELGERKGSAPVLQQSQTLYRSLISADPNELSLQAGLADALFAAGALEETLTLWKKLVESEPTNPRFRRELAQTYNTLAIRNAKERAPEALELHQKALAIREGLAQEFPDDPESHANLGMTLNNIGALLSEEHSAQALAIYRRAFEHSQIAYEQAPQVVLYGRLAAITYGNIANTERVLKRDAEAVAAAERSLEIWKRLTEENPALPYLRVSLRDAYLLLADHQRTAGYLEDMDASIRQVRTLSEKLPLELPGDIYNLACFRARCAEMIGRGKTELTPEEQAERGREADLAMEALWAAVAAGYANPDWMLEEADLASLRERDDFQQLIALLQTGPQAELAAKLYIQQQSLVGQQEKLHDEAIGSHAGSDLADSRHAIGLIQSELGRTDQAITSLHEALAQREALLQAVPQNHQYRVDLAGTHFALSDVFWKVERLSESEAAFQAALTHLKLVPARRLASLLVEKQAQLVDRYGRIGLWEEAAAAQTALAEFYTPGHTDRQYCLALLHANSGREEQYRRLCQDLLAGYDGTEDHNREILFWILNACLLRDNAVENVASLDKAMQVFAETLEGPVNESRPQRWALKSIMDYRAGRYTEAVEGLENGLDEFGGPATARYYLAMAHSRLGRSDEARRLLRDAEQSIPDRMLLDGSENIKYWDRWLAGRLIWREAYDLIENTSAPDDPHLRLLRARSYDRFGRAEQADAEWKAAISLAPNDPQLWIARGQLRAELGDHVQSESDFARACELGAHGIADYLKQGWWVIGPYPEDLRLACPPEESPDPSSSLPPMGQSEEAAPRELHWQRTRMSGEGAVDMRATFNADNISGYALTYVGSPMEQEATLLVGGDDGVRLWVNGELAYEAVQNVPYQFADSVRIKLRPGRNSLLVKVSNGPQHHGFMLREASPLDLARARAKASEWDVAAVEFARELERLPRESGVHSPRKNLCLEIAERPEVFERVVGLRPADADLWIARGRLHVRRSEWEQAYGDYARVIHSYAADEEWVEYSALCLLTERAEEYQQVCQHLDRIAGHHSGHFVKYVLAMACVQSPVTGVDPARPVLWAEGCVQHTRVPWYLHALGFAEYRAGRYADAIKWLEESDRQVPDWSEFGITLNGLVVSMALHQLGLREDSLAMLTKVLPHIEERTPADPSQLTPFGALHWLQLQVLRREAEALIQPALGRGARIGNALPAGPPPPAELILRQRTEAALTGDPPSSADAEIWLARGRMLAVLGEYERAAADFSRGLDLLSQRPDKSWLWKQACMEVVRKPEVYARLVVLRPDDAPLSIERGRFHALHSRWEEALAEYEPVIDSRPPDTEWLEYACLLLLGRGEAEYRDFYLRTVGRMQEPISPRAAFLLARMGALVAEPGIEPARLVAWGEQAVADKPVAYHLHALGGAWYRAGRDEDALQQLEASNAGNWSPQGKAQNGFFLAMMHYRKGNIDEASRWFAQAVQAMERIMPQPSDGVAETNPADWLPLQVLRREAEMLLNLSADDVKAEKTKPPAP